MQTIEIKDNVFLLNTANTSYMFYADKFRHLQHVHYGDRCFISDFEALCLKRCIQYGDTIIYDEKTDDEYTLDSLPLEYGSYGNGDFKEASIEIEDDLSFTCDFLYVSHEIVKEDLKIIELRKKDLTYQQIAEQLNINAKRVDNRIQVLRKHLRRDMEREEI